MSVIYNQRGRAGSARSSECHLTPGVIVLITLWVFVCYKLKMKRAGELDFLTRPRTLISAAKKNIDSDRNKTKQNTQDKKNQTILTETSVRFRPFGYTTTKQAKQTYCFACFVLNVWRTAFSTGRLGRSKNDFLHKYRNSS